MSIVTSFFFFFRSRSPRPERRSSTNLPGYGKWDAIEKLSFWFLKSFWEWEGGSKGYITKYNMVAKKLKYVKGRSRSFESHSSLLHIMHHLVFKSTSRLILSASRFTSLYTCQAISRNCIGCECPSVPYPLPVGSSCLPMSAPSSNRRATLVTGRPSSMFLAPNT